MTLQPSSRFTIRMSSGISLDIRWTHDRGRVYRGHEGIRDFFRESNEAWENVEWDLEDLIDAGEHVIVLVTQRGRGLTSGAEVAGSAVGVWTIRNGKVVRVVWF
jgi:ketosteroid isomerase-like protein